MLIMKYQNYIKKIEKFSKIKKKLPKHISIFPIDKNEITNAILANKKNLNKIINIVHKEIRKKLNLFLKKNKNKKIVIFDIPLLIENKINKKKDILVFVDSKKKILIKKLKKEKIIIKNLLREFKKIQLTQLIKKKNHNL